MRGKCRNVHVPFNYNLTNSVRDLILDHMMSSVSNLKAHLSENLRRVAHGETLVVTDRRKPIARIIPYEMDDLVEKMPSMPFTPAPINIGELPTINSLSLLLAERGEL